MNYFPGRLGEPLGIEKKRYISILVIIATIASPISSKLITNFSSKIVE